MSDTILPASAALPSFASTVADLKQGVEAATNAEIGKDVVAFSQGNLEAVAQASQVFAVGSQDLAREVIASAQAGMTEMLDGVRAILNARTPQAQMELQAELFRNSTSRLVSESTRLAKASLDLMDRSTAPLTARVVLAAEVFGPRKG